MKDINKIFEENLETMVKLILQKNYSGCANIGGDLVRTAWLADFADGIFVAEVLERAFYELNSVIERYEINEKEISELGENMIEQINQLSLSFRTPDKSKLYDTLRSIRVMATCLQLKAYRNLKERPLYQRRRDVQGRIY
jgi:hypothetical protein